MPIVNMHDAKTNLSKLVERAARGEDIIIAKAGMPVAKLVAYKSSQKPRKPGLWKGSVRISADFDELPPEVTAAFLGELL